MKYIQSKGAKGDRWEKNKLRMVMELIFRLEQPPFYSLEENEFGNGRFFLQ